MLSLMTYFIESTIFSLKHWAAVIQTKLFLAQDVNYSLTHTRTAEVILLCVCTLCRIGSKK